MKKLFALSVLLSATVSQADIISCTFTEPFVSSTYSMTQSTLTYDSFGLGKTVIKNVSFQIKSAGEFQLVDKKGNVLQTLTLNKKGSDGMSDRVYPFDVTDTSMNKYANNGMGGCQSNKLKATEDSGN